MNCPICNGIKWQNVDRYRIKPSGMELCQGCGFVGYPTKYKDKAAVLEYYRKDYRGGSPQIANLYSGQNKLHYHADFLQDLIGEWAKEGKKDPVISDVGGAYGLFLQWWKNGPRAQDGAPLFPDADLNGVELTLSYRRVAHHEFGLNLKEDFDESKQYDLITSYKVLEHMYDPQIELQRYKKALKPGGKFYLAVPTWFGKLSNFGVGGWDIEYYYHPDHCNVWTRPHFEKLIRDAGFKIVKENHWTYDSAYMLEVGEETREALPVPNAHDVLKMLQAVQQADLALTKKDFVAATKIWPHFPVARRAVYEHSRAEMHKKGWAAIDAEHIQPWLTLDDKCGDGLLFAADVAARYDKFEECAGYLKRLLEVRPNCQEGFMGMANLNRTMAKKAKSEEDRAQHIAKALEFTRMLKGANVASFAQATTWAYNDMAHLPMPGE